MFFREILEFLRRHIGDKFVEHVKANPLTYYTGAYALLGEFTSYTGRLKKKGFHFKRNAANQRVSSSPAEPIHR